jgi:hypothetical protein
VTFLSDGEFAVTKGIPQLDATIARSGDNLSVVGGERDGKHIVGVANKSAGGGSSGKLPQAESLVPGSRESVGPVGGDDLFVLLEKLVLLVPDPTLGQFHRKYL